MTIASGWFDIRRLERRRSTFTWRPDRWVARGGGTSTGSAMSAPCRFGRSPGRGRFVREGRERDCGPCSYFQTTYRGRAPTRFRGWTCLSLHLQLRPGTQDPPPTYTVRYATERFWGPNSVADKGTTVRETHRDHRSQRAFVERYVWRGESRCSTQSPRTSVLRQEVNMR